MSTFSRTATGFIRSIVLLVALVAFGAATAQVAAPSPEALEGLDAYAAVELANAWKGSDVTSFVTPQAVHFQFTDGREVVIPLPTDVMLVSFAPFLQNTHPCATHYTSGCQGELVRTPFLVQATLADGTVVIDEILSTQANGFIDLWLPRGESVEVSFAADGYHTVGRVTTFADSPTCITTLQLSRSGG
jgi:hypothetical protein